MSKGQMRKQDWDIYLEWAVLSGLQRRGHASGNTGLNTDGRQKGTEQGTEQGIEQGSEGQGTEQGSEGQGSEQGSEGQGRFTKVLEEMTRVAPDHGQIQPDDTTLLGLIDAYLRLDDMYCIVLALY